jgi:hexosaminidase
MQLEELGLTHEKNVRVLLRRLAQSRDISSLETLVSVVEPVKEYRRYQMRPQTMLAPLTGLIDAARPDSLAARRFGTMVEALLSDAPRFQLRRESTNDELTRWRDAGLSLDALIERSPALHEAKPLAKNLRQIGEAGLEAMSFLTTGVAPSAEWRQAKLALLDEAAKPKAALEFAIVPAVMELVIAASELPQLRQTTPIEWRKNVRALARQTGK